MQWPCLHHPLSYVPRAHLCLRFLPSLFRGSVAPAVVPVPLLDFMVSFQDLVAFQQAELLGFMALQSYLKIIAKVNQKQGGT